MARSASAIVVLLSAFASVASAQSDTPPRVFGGGVALGGGLQGWNDYDHGPGYRPAGIGANLGTLELMSFFDDHFSVDFSFLTWLPVMDAIVTGDAAYTSTVYLDWSFGEGARLVIGPGLGISGHTVSSGSITLEGAAGAQLRIAGLLGVELVGRDHLFGFRIVTRPWLSLGGGAAGFQAGGGALLESIFMFYAL